MSTYSITKKREGRFNDLYAVTINGEPLVTDVAYLRARKALHAQGVSAEKHLEVLDGMPVGDTHTFEVK